MTMNTIKVKEKQRNTNFNCLSEIFLRQIKQNIAREITNKFSIRGGINKKLFTSLNQGFVKTLSSASGASCQLEKIM